MVPHPHSCKEAPANLSRVWCQQRTWKIAPSWGNPHFGIRVRCLNVGGRRWGYPKNKGEEKKNFRYIQWSGSRSCPHIFSWCFMIFPRSCMCPRVLIFGQHPWDVSTALVQRKPRCPPSPLWHLLWSVQWRFRSREETSEVISTTAPADQCEAAHLERALVKIIIKAEDGIGGCRPVKDSAVLTVSLFQGN